MQCSAGPGSWPGSTPGRDPEATVRLVPRSSRLLHLPVAALLLLLAVGCGDDGPGEYDAETRASFLEGCIEDDTDTDLVEVCECTYDTMEAELPYERFEAVEARLRQGSPDMPEDVASIVVGCIREVSASRS